MDAVEKISSQRLVIDIFSDIVCPWCFIGKRHLETALHQFSSEQPQISISVRWLPYFLNPETPMEGDPYRPFLENKFGGQLGVDALWERVRDSGKYAGIEFYFEKIKLRINTLNAHRLIHRTQQQHGNADAIVERLFSAYFQRGENINDPAVLVANAFEEGLDPTKIQAYLATTDDSYNVLLQAKQALEAGISGVPFFIFNGRQAVSGAQLPEVFLEVMHQMLDQS